MRTILNVLGILLLCTFFTACSTTKENVAVQNADNKKNTHNENNVSKERDSSEMESLFWARKDSAKMTFVQADVEFMQGMIGHHAQALVMSALAPKNDASLEVRTLASRIINAQKDEIGIMQTWLYDRGQAVPQVKIDGLMLTTTMGEKPMLMFHPDGMEHDEHEMDEDEHAMNHEQHMADGTHEKHQMEGHDMEHSEMENADEMDHSEHTMSDMGGMMHDHSTMPGMLSQAQLEELAAAKGKEFDELFLRYMIQHHSGAITMVNDLLEADGAMQELAIGKLAGDINVDQKTEIERMRLMLVNLVSNPAN